MSRDLASGLKVLGRLYTLFTVLVKRMVDHGSILVIPMFTCNWMKMFVTFSQPVSLPWWHISPERHRRRVVYLEATGVGHPVLRLWASETPMLAIWMDPHPWVSFFFVQSFQIVWRMCWEHQRAPAIENTQGLGLDIWLIFFLYQNSSFYVRIS